MTLQSEIYYTITNDTTPH